MPSRELFFVFALNIIVTVIIRSSSPFMYNFCHVQINREVRPSGNLSALSLYKFNSACSQIQLAYALDDSTFMSIAKDISISPDNILNTIQIWQGHNSNSSIVHLNKFLVSYPDYGDALYLLAQEYTNQNRYSESIELLDGIRRNKLTGMVYGESDILVMLGLATQQVSGTHQWTIWSEDALEFIEESLSINDFLGGNCPSRCKYAKQQLAIQLYRQKKWDDSRVILTRLLDEDYSLYYTCYFLGLLEYKVNNYELSLDHMQCALRNRKKYHRYVPVAYHRAAQSSFHLQDINLYKEILEEGLSYYPNSELLQTLPKTEPQ